MSGKHVSIQSTFICAGLAVVPVSALAQSAPDDQPPERLVVTASRLGAVRSDLLGSSATVLEPLDLELRQTAIVSDVLRDVPGVAVSRAGPVGEFTQIRIRGAESNHTLVLIDGIKASDPFFGEFDFATLIADDVAKVEVLRGEQSALYGSDAIGGIIQYITATGAEAPGVRARVEGGSFDTIDGSLRVAGVAGALDYAISGAYYATAGTPDNRFGTRSLGSQNSAISGKFAYALSGNFRLKAVARYSSLRADLNEQDFNFPPGPNYGFEIDSNAHYRNTSLNGLASAEFEGLDGRWRNALSIQGVDAERNGFGGFFAPADQRTSGDKGTRVRASYVTSLDFGSMDVAQKLTGAVDYERETYRNTDPTGFADTSTRHSTDYGYVGQYDLVFNDRLALGTAARFDENYRFANAFTYRLQASYRFDNGFRPHAAVGTGIKAPTIYQLYGYTPGFGSFIGNPDLKPEKSQGWEAGFDQTLFGRSANLGITYFNARLKDEIVVNYLPPNFAASPENAAMDSPREGVETSLSARLGRQWRIDLAYTYLSASENGEKEVRRAPDIASANIAWRWPDGRYGMNLTVRYNGDQEDLNFTLSGPPRVRLPAYTLVNLGADYRVNDMWQVYGRVENLFNSKYEEVYTIRSSGIAFYAGLRASLQ
jgi:vitamin B12 transporter